MQSRFGSASISHSESVVEVSKSIFNHLHWRIFWHWRFRQHQNLCTICHRYVTAAVYFSRAAELCQYLGQQCHHSEDLLLGPTEEVCTQVWIMGEIIQTTEHEATLQLEIEVWFPCKLKLLCLFQIFLNCEWINFYCQFKLSVNRKKGNWD